MDIEGRVMIVTHQASVRRRLGWRRGRGRTWCSRPATGSRSKLDDLVAVVELNVYGALLATQAVILVMRARGAGSIINVSSGTTRMAAPVGTSGHTATKAALNVLSRSARAELAGDGIVVSTVYPFVTATEFHETLRAGSLRVGSSVRAGQGRVGRGGDPGPRPQRRGGGGGRARPSWTPRRRRTNGPDPRGADDRSRWPSLNRFLPSGHRRSKS